MELTENDFNFLRKLIFDESAIVLDPGKEYLVESRLAPILRKEELGSYGELVETLKRPSSTQVRELIVDAMTTNETSFFRDGHPWDSLRDELLPELIEARSNVKRLTIWCAASSSGQEPYSLAMLIHEHFPEIAEQWSVRIMGTDLSPKMVERATAGKFSQLEVNRGLPARMLMKYFSRVGADWQINEELRRIVDIRRGNLIEANSWAQIPFVDAVFVRNVLIYFDKETRAQILERVHDRLRSDGFLMLGSSETAVGVDGRYERRQVGKTVLFQPLVADRTPATAS
jgi:chemotaxis protein methyltransferase CheR